MTSSNPRSWWRRTPAAAALASLLLTLLLVPAGPAHALERSDGDDPGPRMETLEVIGVFIGIPLAIYLVVWVLTFAPGTTRKPSRSRAKHR
ncbi:hypothetical protein [Motilibacter aurantiacus]|uniref:hypothetical protein n=1 Tax=Motilibacter aurantiacus TaxID=2714955 RepID=UPI001408CCCF|nr:hypothetical protein [Motilibacter aurantiacus]NHC45140.1 hypothetical protein [Motilibacter aurantiacus]